jgi:menaquinone-dependent protoporphyrinogen oxidase
MRMSTLIMYASKHGSAEKCAEKLSEKLTGKVDLCNIKEGKIPDLTGYEKIIIGGSIYAGRIQKELGDFCLKNIGLLKEKKTGLFICCMVKSSEEAQIKSSFPKELLSSAVVKESFGGEFRFKDMNLAEKVITKMVSKALSKKDDSMSISDMKKDIYMISDEKINEFANLMNNA